MSGVIDTGSSITILPEEVCKSLDLPSKGAFSTHSALVGKVELTRYDAIILTKDKTLNTSVVGGFALGPPHPIIGWDVLSQLPLEDILKDFRKSLPLLRDLEQKWRSVLEPHESSKAKGDALEDFIEFILKSIKGTKIVFRNRRTETEEIDLVVSCEGEHPLRSTLGTYFMIECKNWMSSRVGAPEVREFFAKLYKRRGEIKVGYLISTGTFTEDATKEALQLSGEMFITLVDNNDLVDFVQHPPKEFSDFFIKSYERKALFPRFGK